jgi:hypothetical protein
MERAAADRRMSQLVLTFNRCPILLAMFFIAPHLFLAWFGLPGIKHSAGQIGGAFFESTKYNELV